MSGALPRLDEGAIQRAFTRCDSNSRGYLTSNDVEAVLRGIGTKNQPSDVGKMIALADRSGIGRVTYDDFRRLVLVLLMGMPEAEFLKLPVPELEQPAGRRAVEGAAAGATDGPEAAARERAKAKRPAHAVPKLKLKAPEAVPEKPQKRTMKVRSEMRATLALFAAEKSIDLERLEDAVWKATHAHGRKIVFGDFCDALDCHHDEIAPAVFKVFQTGLHTDIRLLTIALSSVLPGFDAVAKAKFAFAVCDLDDTGSIGHGDLEDILRANHITLERDEVKRKCELIVAATRSREHISFEDYLGVAKRFVNVLFPLIRAPGAARS